MGNRGTRAYDLLDAERELLERRHGTGLRENDPSLVHLARSLSSTQWPARGLGGTATSTHSSRTAKVCSGSDWALERSVSHQNQTDLNATISTWTMHARGVQLRFKTAGGGLLGSTGWLSERDRFLEALGAGAKACLVIPSEVPGLAVAVQVLPCKDGWPSGKTVVHLTSDPSPYFVQNPGTGAASAPPGLVGVLPYAQLGIALAGELVADQGRPN